MEFMNIMYISFIKDFEGLECIYGLDNDIIKFYWTVGEDALYDDTSNISFFKTLVGIGDLICPEVMTRWSL